MKTQTISKKDFIGPIINKKQRTESLDWFNNLSKSYSLTESYKQLELEQYESTIEVLELMDLTNEQIDKIISIVKSKKTSTHRPGPNTGVGKRCRELIKEGLTNKEVLSKIKEEFPANNTTYSCVAWYRNNMKN